MLGWIVRAPLGHYDLGMADLDPIRPTPDTEEVSRLRRELAAARRERDAYLDQLLRAYAQCARPPTHPEFPDGPALARR